MRGCCRFSGFTTTAYPSRVQAGMTQSAQDGRSYAMPINAPIQPPDQQECISSRIVSRTTSASDKPSTYCFNASFIMV